METKSQYLSFIRWSARIIAILFAAFLSIFAADVFEEKRSFWMMAFALCMHLIPVFVILIILLISWKHEWLGGFFYPILGGLYIWWAWGRYPLSVYFLISGPLLLLGALYLICWFFSSKAHQ